MRMHRERDEGVPLDLFHRLLALKVLDIHELIRNWVAGIQRYDRQSCPQGGLGSTGS